MTTHPTAYDTAIAHGTVTLTNGRPTYPVTKASTPRHRDRIVVGGRDVTYYRGIPTPTPDFQLVEPFMYGAATLTLPQISPLFEQLGTGKLRWLRIGATVKVQRVDVTTKKVVATDYVGVITAFNVDGPTLVCDVGGQVTGRAALREQQVPIFRIRIDPGHKLFQLVTHNGARFRPRLPDTGMLFDPIGGMSELDYGNQLVSMMVKKDGTQYTVMPDATGTYRLSVKDTTTIAATAYFDDTRLAPSVKRDAAEEPNAIYATGVQSDGRRVRFAVYPGLVEGPPAPYPFANKRAFGVGTTEADTDDPAAGLIRAMLLRLTIMGYLDRSDTFDGYTDDVSDAVEDLQRDAGLTVTGTMNLATWRALYDLDATGYSLLGTEILPAAETSAVRLWDRTSSGAHKRHNPGYDKHALRVERSIDVGTGFTRRQIRRFARHELSTGSDWVGTLACNLALIAGQHTPGDPLAPVDVLPARAMRPGMNVWAPHFDGGTLFHISGVNVTAGGSSVELTIDTKARDTMKAWEVIHRNRDSRANLARAWVRQHRSSTINKDGLSEWDPIGGQISDRVNLKGGHWTVFPVVAGQEGTIARINLQTTPAAEFVAAVFGKHLTAHWLQSRVPAPLSTAGTKHWESPAFRNRLDDKILLYIAGANSQPCGYWPGEKTDANGATGKPLTGAWFDDAGFAYRTFNEPVLYVAIWADRDSHLEDGRIMWNQLEAGS